MREIVAHLIDAAAEMSSDVMVVLKDEDSRKRDALVSKVERLLHKIQNNESMRTFVHRREEPGKTTILIGMDDHEAKGAIVKALWTKAEREAGDDMQIWTKDLKARTAGKVLDKRVAREMISIARELLD
jgi:hypothetical protein